MLSSICLLASWHSSSPTCISQAHALQEALETAAQSNRLAEQYEEQQQKFAQLYEQQSEILTSTRVQLGTCMVSAASADDTPCFCRALFMAASS